MYVVKFSDYRLLSNFDFLESTCSLDFLQMAFKLKKYELLSSEIVKMWDHILDIVGPVRNWPPEIRNLFFQRFKPCSSSENMHIFKCKLIRS